MKKLVMTVAVLTCAASIASAQTVTSANMVGYSKVDSGGQELTFVALNFLDGGSATVSSIMGTEFADNTIVYVWDKAIHDYLPGSKFSRGLWSNDHSVDAGDALWISDNGDVGSVTTVIINGEVLLDETNTVSYVAEISDATGYYYPVDIDLLTSSIGVALDDNSLIFTWNDVSQEYFGWKKSRGSWVAFIGGSPATAVVGPSDAFWVQSSASESIDVVRPFTP